MVLYILICHCRPYCRQIWEYKQNLINFFFWKMFLKTVLKNDFKCYYLIFCKIKFYFETLLLACFLYFKNYNVLFFIILHICIINFWNISVKLKNIYIDNIYFFFFKLPIYFHSRKQKIAFKTSFQIWL